MERILKSKYKILDKISETSAHATYNGAYVDSGKPVAIKIFKREYLNSTLIKELKKDITRLAKLEHSGIARLLDGDYGWQGFYFIREFIDGDPVREIKKPFDEDSAIKTAAAVCEALAYAHSQGFVHGSLTAGNVFCGKNAVTVADFGIKASVCRTGENRSTILFDETAGWSAPEVVLGQCPSHLSDIYQVGILLFYMLTGELPVKGNNGFETALKALRQTLPAPSSLNGKVPRYLDEIVAKCLEKEPGLRFDSIRLLADSLKNKALILPKNELLDLPEISAAPAEEPPREEKTPAPLPVQEKSDRINLFKWVVFAVWAAIAAGVIYSLINIFVMGE